MALIEVVNESTQKRLNIADREVTHVVHILRTSLVTDADPPAQVILDTIAEITRYDGTVATYRVRDYRDDEHKPQVEFFCILAPATAP